MAKKTPNDAKVRITLPGDVPSPVSPLAHFLTFACGAGGAGGAVSESDV